MKKILVAALVAILASSFVFAGFSGKAKVGLGYNFETGYYGFTNETGFNVNVDLATASAEKVAEGNVYAGIKASLDVKVANKEGGKGTGIWEKDGNPELGIGAFVKVDEAFVAGENWKVSIGSLYGIDYAKSYLDRYWKEDVKDAFGNKYDYKFVPGTFYATYSTTPGLTLTFADWTVAAGFAANSGKGSVKAEDKYYNFKALVETPEFEFEGITVKAAAIASRDVTNKEAKYNYTGAAGISTKVGFDFDAVSGSVAADYGIKRVDGKNVQGFDAVANLAVSPVEVEVYYQNKDFAKKDNNLLSAEVVTDLNSFEVPVKLTVTGKDLIRKQELSLAADFAIDAFELSSYVGYTIKTKELSTGASVAYNAEAFKASAGVDFETDLDAKNTHVLAVNAAVESEVLVPGAILKLGYGRAKKDMNLLKDQAKKQNFGKVEASCTIKF